MDFESGQKKTLWGKNCTSREVRLCGEEILLKGSERL